MPSTVENPHEVANTFRALGDPVRRAMVEHLSISGDATVNELAALFPISLQAVSRHIKVLESAGIVSQRREGKTRPVSLQPARLQGANDWLERRRRQLEDRYRQLDQILAELQEGTNP